MLVFSGRAKVKINQQRLVFPVEFRDQCLEEGDDEVLITIRPDFKSILIYPYSYWKSFHDAMSNGDLNQRKLISLLRFYAMPKQKFEGPGRIKIEPDLLKRAKITGNEAWTLGEGFAVSMWNAEAFEEEEQKRLAEVSEINFNSWDFGSWNSTTDR